MQWIIMYTVKFIQKSLVQLIWMCSKSLLTHLYKGTSYKFWQKWYGHYRGSAFSQWLGFISWWGDGSLTCLWKTSLIIPLKALAGTITMSHVAIFGVIFNSTSIHHLPLLHLLAPTVHTGFSMAMESKAKEIPLSFWTWWQTSLPCLIFPLVLFDIFRLY